MMTKFDIAVDQGEQRVVTAHADMIAGLDLGAALANNNATCCNQLSIKAFYTEHLGVAVPAIAGTTHTFFMCHDLFFLRTTFRAFLCTTFRAFSIFGILNPWCATTAARSLLSIGISCFTYRGFCLGCSSSCCRGYHLVTYRSFPLPGSLAGDQALSIGDNIVDTQDGKFLAMTTAMAIALLGFVLEDDHLFVASLPDGSCEHHGIVYQRGTYH